MYYYNIYLFIIIIIISKNSCLATSLKSLKMYNGKMS